MSLRGTTKYREFMAQYARGDLSEALKSLDTIVANSPIPTGAAGLEVGALQIQRGALLFRLARRPEANAAFELAEQLLDPITFDAQMATFFARFGDDPASALFHAERLLRTLGTKQESGPLDDGEQYYQRTALEIQRKEGHL